MQPGKPASKAKAKAKGKAKVKAAGKAKKKAKSSPKKVVKPPKKPVAQKKPAGKAGTGSAKAKAKASSLKDMTQSWRAAATTEKEVAAEGEGEEEHAKEHDPEVDPSGQAVLDYNKSRKWSKPLKSALVPEDLKAMYQEGLQKADSARIFKAAFINKVFTRTDNGEYILNPGNAQFTSFKENFDLKFATNKSKGLPPSIMLWKYFHGNEAGMKAAAEQGDIYFKHGFWYFTSKDDGMKLAGGTADLGVEEFKEMNKWMGSRPWSGFGQVEESTGSASVAGLGGDKPSRMRAILDKEPDVPKVPFGQVESSRQQAKGAQERLYRQCQQLDLKVQTNNDTVLETELKEVMNNLVNNEKELQDVLLWRKIPGTSMLKNEVDAYMDNKLAQSTEKSDEKLDQIKAVIKSRRW